MVVTSTLGLSVMLILRPSLHSREVLIHPHQVLLQWHHDRVRVCRVSPASSGMIRVLLPVFWVIATPGVLAVPTASKAARRHLRTPPIQPRFPMRCVKPALLVFLLERFSASEPM